ncbi:MAG TPA: hypothetical protein VMS31_15620, partial [Pyrinomonadaceae bacterium]|nr:hypothetical protein [Pyrinomonadaceae bacterium]
MQTVGSLLNTVLANREYQSWEDLTFYVLAASCRKTKSRFSSKYFDILKSITDDMFAEDIADPAPMITPNQTKHVRDAIETLDTAVGSRFHWLDGCIQNAKPVTVTTEVAQDLFKLLLCILEAIFSSVTVVCAVMHDRDATKEQLASATVKLFTYMESLEGIVHSEAIKFIFTGYLKGTIAHQIWIVDERRAAKLAKLQDESRVAAAAKEEARRMRVQDAAAKRAAASQIKVQAQMARMSVSSQTALEESMRKTSPPEAPQADGGSPRIDETALDAPGDDENDTTAPDDLNAGQEGNSPDDWEDDEEAVAADESDDSEHDIGPGLDATPPDT